MSWGYPLPQLLCDENQIQNIDDPVAIHVSSCQSYFHSELDFLCPGGDTIPGTRAEEKVLQCNPRVTLGFRLELDPNQGAAAIQTAFAEPSRNQSRNLTGCVVNAPALKEGRFAIGLQETAFAYFNRFKDGRVEDDVELPPRQVDYVFCLEHQG